MHYLFYGEDTFSINEKVKSLSDKFTQIHSDLNLVNLDGGSLTLDNFIAAVNTQSFFGSKKLIVIKNLLLENKDNELKRKVAEKLDKTSSESTVVFVEYGLLDMRSALFKKLNQPKIAQKFDSPKGNKLSAWVKDRVEKAGGKISQRAVEKLSVFVGSNLWRLDNEISKLLLYSKGLIEDGDIDEMVCAENNSSIFNYIDALTEKNSAKALSILSALIQSGEDSLYIFSMIVYQFRNLLFVLELTGENFTPVKISTEAKIHPFVVKKSQGFLKRYTKNKLQEIYSELGQIDSKIKSGGLDANLALDFLTVRLCKA